MRRGTVAYAWSDAGRTTQLVAGCAAASSIATITAVAPFSAPAAFVMLLSGGLVGGAVARWTIGADSASRVVTRAVLGGALVAFVQGGCVLPFTLWISTASNMSLDGLVAAWVWIAMLAAIVGGPLGAAVALFYTPLLIVANKAQRQPSHAAGEHVGRFASVWLALAAGLHLLVIHGMMGNRAPETAAQGVMWKLAWGVPLVLAFGTLGAGVVSRVVRRRWLARVRDGAVAGYRVEPIAVGDPRGHVLLPVEHGGATCDEVIVRIAEASNPGYRDLAAPVEDEPVALLRSSQ